MKSFIIKIFILFAAVAVIDILIGVFGSKLSVNIHNGVYGRDNYIANEANEDVLIFGSSRAVHHYNAKLLQDSLGLSCYNCGDDGCGIILSYGRLMMNLERHRPKIVIQDIVPAFDISKSDNSKFLGSLKTNYDHPSVVQLFKDIDPLENVKMMSHLYQYNSKLHHMLFVYLTNSSHDTGIQGFRPSKGEMDTMKIVKHREKSQLTVDSLKMVYLNRFIEDAGDAVVVFVVSPIWYGMDERELLPVKAICKQHNILFFDFSNNPKYVHHQEYFKDGAHLNDRGADEFTRDLIRLLKKESSVAGVLNGAKK